MARQLATRTVIEWFGTLSFDQQKDALAKLKDEHDQSLSAKRAELEQQLAALGYSATKKRGRPKGVKNAKAAGKPGGKRNGKKASVKAKYRDPKTSETWSGRGRMAGWLKSKQDAGEKIEKYLI